jgi:hypothetical protein
MGPRCGGREIRETVSLDALDERALMLAGLPPADIDEGISAICRELEKIGTLSFRVANHLGNVGSNGR